MCTCNEDSRPSSDCFDKVIIFIIIIVHACHNTLIIKARMEQFASGQGPDAERFGIIQFLVPL
jgi:hypothetical protein